MNKKEARSKWIELILKAGFSALVLIQIGFCLRYLWINGGKLQLFEESLRYINASFVMQTNGWQMIGYPMLIAMIRAVFGSRYIWGIFIFQLFVAVFSLYYSVCVFNRVIWRKTISIQSAILIVTFLVTNPFVFQMITAVLPDSLEIDLFLLSACLVMLLIWGEQRFWSFRILGILGCAFGLSLLNRYYLWCLLLEILIIVIAAICQNGRSHYQYKRVWKLLLLVGSLFIAISAGWLINYKTTDSSNYMKYSLIANLTERFVYPELEEDSKNYPGVVKGALPEIYFHDNAHRMFQFKENFAPKLEKEYGIKQANKLYAEMIKTAFKLRTVEIGKGLARDLSFHYAQIFLAIKMLLHNNNSRYGYNISRMWDGDSLLVMKMFLFGSSFQVVMGIIALGKSIYDRLILKRKGNVLAMLLALFPAIVLTFIMTVCSPKGTDYRIGLCFSVVLFLIFSSSLGNGRAEKFEEGSSSME